MNWRWLPTSSVLGAHQKSLFAFGGPDGVRDRAMLESALARAKNLAAYEDPDCCRLAAAYAYGLVQNHPFVDGNKRTSFLAAFMFLELNDFELVALE
ncbi:MAG: type II toxin-antitoxin system death-on-curing family toxin, partial [Pseudomonadota bacterium]